MLALSWLLSFPRPWPHTTVSLNGQALSVKKYMLRPPVKWESLFFEKSEFVTVSAAMAISYFWFVTRDPAARYGCLTPVRTVHADMSPSCHFAVPSERHPIRNHPDALDPVPCVVRVSLISPDEHPLRPPPRLLTVD